MRTSASFRAATFANALSDLHHRYGRAGQSFGKETAVWDTLFGTRNKRLETRESSFVKNPGPIVQ